MAASGSGAVFFLGSRAHYQVLQPNNYDAANGNTSTETICQNPSFDELWPRRRRDEDIDVNSNPELQEFYNDVRNNGNERSRAKRSSEEPLCENTPAALDNVDNKKYENKPKPSIMSILASFTRRKRRQDSNRTQYLKHIESVLNRCTYRESCRCMDCQSRYFECGDESDEERSEEDYSSYSVQEESQAVPEELDDDVFLDSSVENDNTSTDLLLEEPEEPQEEQEEGDDEEDYKQLQMEVAASTSAMFNVLLYHPFSCVLQ